MAHGRFVPLAALVLMAGACSSAPTSTPAASSAPSPSSAASASPSPDVTDAPSPTATQEPSTPAGPATWRQLEPSGSRPAAREDGTWVIQPGAAIAFLFGGRDGSTVFGDFWAFDLETEAWTELDPGGDQPPARFGHEAVWVDGYGVVVFAGQAGPTTFFDDLWAYDSEANRWRELPVDGARPTARYGTCAAVGPDGRLWISHGFTEDGTRFADTQAYDFATGRWMDETPEGRAPVRRCLHGCWWTDDGRFALYAGQTTGVTALGDLWTLADPGTAGAAWSETTGALPPDRNLFSFARHDDSLVVTGGRGLDGFLDDVFTLDTTTLAAEALTPEGTPPPGRAGAMLIDDSSAGRALLFGGKSGDGALGDLWELTLP